MSDMQIKNLWKSTISQIVEIQRQFTEVEWSQIINKMYQLRD